MVRESGPPRWHYSSLARRTQTWCIICQVALFAPGRPSFAGRDRNRRKCRRMPRYVALIDGAAGAYGVLFPDLPGCTAMGWTMDDALDNAGEALRDWAEVTEEGGGKIPRPRNQESLRRDSEVKRALAGGASLATIPLVRETGKPVKANLSIDSGVLAALDEEAERRNLTRPGFVEMLARTMLTKVA